MNMVWHDNRFFNLNRRVKMGHGFQLRGNNFTVRRRRKVRGVEDAAPYDLPKDRLAIFCTYRDEIGANCAVIKGCKPIRFALCRFHYSNRMVTLLAWACRPSCSAKLAMRAWTSPRASRV